MGYSSSLLGYCSVASQVAPTSAPRLIRPYHLPLSHPLSHQGQLFTMLRNQIDCVESQRTPHKNPKTSGRPFSNMRTRLSPDIPAAERFRIVKDGCLAATIVSTM